MAEPLRLEWLYPDTLEPNPANWRRHPTGQAKALEALLYGDDGVGWAGAALYNEATGRLIDGHLRRDVAARHGEPIPVLVGSWTEEQERKILATLDPLAAMAEADREALGALLAGVQSSDAAVMEMLAGLAEREGVLFGGNGDGQEPPEPQTDRAEELQAKWNVASGDVWQAGEHYVMCGDCREPGAWERLLKAAGVEWVNGVFTSPPYAEQRKAQYGGVPVAEYVDWWEAVQANVRAHLAEDGSFFVNIKPHCEDGQRVLYVFDLVLAMVRRWGWRFVDELCWTHQGVPGKWNNRFKNGFEPIYQFSLFGQVVFNPLNVSEKKDTAFRGKGGGLNSYYDPNNAIEHSTRAYWGEVLPPNIIRLNFPSASKEFVGHGAQFPVALPTFFVKAYSDPGDVWCDPFLGSGTTICAAHQNGRQGVGIEKLEKYVAVTLERLTGLGLTPRRLE